MEQVFEKRLLHFLVCKKATTFPKENHILE